MTLESLENTVHKEPDTATLPLPHFRCFLEVIQLKRALFIKRYEFRWINHSLSTSSCLLKFVINNLTIHCHTYIPFASAHVNIRTSKLNLVLLNARTDLACFTSWVNKSTTFRATPTSRWGAKNSKAEFACFTTESHFVVFIIGLNIVCAAQSFTWQFSRYSSTTTHTYVLHDDVARVAS